jgi:hypothetical protein
MKTFPELTEDDHAKLSKLDEDWMKSNDGKDRWRTFMARLVHCPYAYIFDQRDGIDMKRK